MTEERCQWRDLVRWNREHPWVRPVSGHIKRLGVISATFNSKLQYDFSGTPEPESDIDGTLQCRPALCDIGHMSLAARLWRQRCVTHKDASCKHLSERNVSTRIFAALS
jgi:hypothetical protein